MKAIRFDRFRKFIEFPELKFGDITLLVGTNNSGKSTLLKALMLVVDNLKWINYEAEYGKWGVHDDLLPFRFDANGVHDLKIGTYDRAVTHGMEKKGIKFGISLGDGEDDERGFCLVFRVVPNVKNGKFNVPEGQMRDLVFVDRLYGIKYSFATKSQTMSVEVQASQIHNIQETERFEYAIADFREDDRFNIKRNSALAQFIEYMAFLYKTENNNYSEAVYDLLNESAVNLDFNIQALQYVYLKAEPVSRRSLYIIDDRNDNMAQAIQNFAKSEIETISKGRRFINQWMREFGIGSSFEYGTRDGEAYWFEVIDEYGNHEKLSDLGMGTNHLMMLFLRIGTVINNQRHRETPTIVIEEPEQNLHPALQSKLADFLYDLSYHYHIKTIVETHSEYLIRRSQVIVLKEDLIKKERNPFKVYYFPEDGVPYDMNYLESGRFENSFGAGFLDEAARWHLEIVRSENRRPKRND